MQPTTCPTCGHEFETPVPGEAGPCCPRCGEQIRSFVGSWPPVATLDTYLGVMVVGAILGLVTACILLLGRS